MNNLTAEQRLTRATVWLMNQPKYAAFAGLYTMGSVEVKDGIPTACTNGRDEFYGRAFLDTLVEPEVRGVKLHETWHKAGRHMIIYKHLAKEDPKLANMAMDYVINLFIHDSDIDGKEVRLPKGALLDQRFRNMDIQQVYNILKQEKQNGQGNGGGKAGEGTADAGGEGEFVDEHDWDSADSISADEAEAFSKQVDEALRQGQLIAGKLGANVPRAIEEMLKPYIDWRSVLSEFVSAHAAGHDLPSYKKPNRRMMGGDIILPTQISESVGKLVLGIDASGSIFGDTLNGFMAYVKMLCESVMPESVELLYWDTEVCQHETYDANSYAGLVTSTKPKGGGGTRPACVSEYIRKRGIDAACIVMLTDGHVDGWGRDWPAPTLWCITEKRITSPIGKSVHIDA